MDGDWDILVEWLSEQAVVAQSRLLAFSEQEECHLWTTSMGTTWELARYANPAASDSLGVEPREVGFNKLPSCISKGC